MYLGKEIVDYKGWDYNPPIKNNDKKMSDLYNEVVSKLEGLTDKELTNLLAKIQNTRRVIIIGNWYSRDHINQSYPSECRDWRLKKTLGEIDEENYYTDLFDSLVDCVGDGIDSAFDEIDYQVKNSDSQLWEYKW